MHAQKLNEEAYAAGQDHLLLAIIHEPGSILHLCRALKKVALPY
jgi:hypothetical protein